MDKFNIHNYEILIKQKDDYFLAFCPQLNIIFKDSTEEIVNQKIKNHIKDYIKDLRNKNQIDKKEKEYIKKRAVLDVEQEFKENIIEIHKDSSENKDQIDSTESIQVQNENKYENIDISEFDGLFLNEDSMI